VGRNWANRSRKSKRIAQITVFLRVRPLMCAPGKLRRAGHHFQEPDPGKVFAKLVTELTGILRKKLTAYIASVKDARAQEQSSVGWQVQNRTRELKNGCGLLTGWRR
jgi:hypothetical protein